MSITKEIFGIDQKEIDVYQGSELQYQYEMGFNNALFLINQFGLSEEELAKIITSEYYPCDERATLLAKQIIQNQSKIFVRKNEKTS